MRKVRLRRRLLTMWSRLEIRDNVIILNMPTSTKTAINFKKKAENGTPKQKL